MGLRTRAQGTGDGFKKRSGRVVLPLEEEHGQLGPDLSNASADGELLVVSEGETDYRKVVMGFEQAPGYIVDFQD